MSDDKKNDEKSIEELRGETQMTSRAASTNTTPSFAEHLHDGFDAVEQGDVSPTVAAKSEEVAALLAALDADEDRRAEVGKALAEALGTESDSSQITKSELIRNAIRVGLREAGDGVAQEVAEVQQERMETF